MKKNTTKSQTLVVKNEHLKMVNPNVAGIDVGANSIFVCAGFENGTQQVREFSTFTADLNAMASWLQECGIKSVAMESTGVYWIATYDILTENGFEVLLVNSYAIKVINRKKTDVQDCQQIQQLHSYGLLQGSFRPDDQGVTFRGYVRQRERLIKDSSIQIHLMHKALTQMNIQLRQVLNEITGMTGLLIIRAIVAGERDPRVLAKYRQKSCRKSEKEIAKALEGNYREELVFALKQTLEAYDFFQSQIAECDRKINYFIAHCNGQTDQTTTETNNPEQFDVDYQKTAAMLTRILGVDLTKVPGLNGKLLIKIIAEIGTDLTRWPSEKHFASWLGLCPDNQISGGKILNNRTRHVINKAAQALRFAANTLYRSKTFIGAHLRRLRARIGTPKAITATAHKLAVIIYTMITQKREYIEFGHDAYEQRHKDRAIERLKRKAADLGFEIVTKKTESAVIF